MSLNISSITNPWTNGRGEAILCRPHESSSLAVRYDEYDSSPTFFVSMLDDQVTVISVDDHDDGCSIRLGCKDGEVTLTLGVPLWKFMNSLNGAFDEWSQS